MTLFRQVKKFTEEFNLFPMCVSDAEVTLCDGGEFYVSITRAELERLLRTCTGEAEREREYERGQGRDPVPVDDVRRAAETVALLPAGSNVNGPTREGGWREVFKADETTVRVVERDRNGVLSPARIVSEVTINFSAGAKKS